MTVTLASIHILVVEDTMTQALMIQHVLEKEGARVTIARSGEKAVKLLSEMEKQPDLVLCDVNMPEMSGFELCLKLKSEQATRDLPFVLLSTLVDHADLVNVINCRADNFIYKTFDEEYFLPRLRAILASLSDTQEQLQSQPGSVTLTSGGRSHEVQVTAQRLANLLVSAFETAVFHNRGQKSD